MFLCKINNICKIISPSLLTFLFENLKNFFTNWCGLRSIYSISYFPLNDEMEISYLYIHMHIITNKFPIINNTNKFIILSTLALLFLPQYYMCTFCTGMEHEIKLNSICRICGIKIPFNSKSHHKEKFKHSVNLLYNIDILTVHPPKICRACRLRVTRYSNDDSDCHDVNLPDLTTPRLIWTIVTFDLVKLVDQRNC